MKRSAQVALLFGGLAAAGTGAYAIMPANQACTSPQQPQAGAIPGGGTTAAGLAAPLPGATVPATAPAALAAAGQPNPCERPRRRWYDSSYSSYNSGRYYGSRSIWGSRSSSTTTTRPSTSVSYSGSSSSRTSFGGFGKIGSSVGHYSS
jgi:hypothetical protein